MPTSIRRSSGRGEVAAGSPNGRPPHLSIAQGWRWRCEPGRPSAPEPMVRDVNRAVGLVLLASAFAPVVAVLAVVQSDSLGAWTAVIVALCLASVLFLLVVLRTTSRVQNKTLPREQVRRSDESVLAFTSAYLLPVAITVFAADNTLGLAGSSVIVLLLGVIYARGELYHLNPTLALLGFRLYEITDTSGVSTMVLSRAKHLKQKGDLDVQLLADYVAIQLRGKS